MNRKCNGQTFNVKKLRITDSRLTLERHLFTAHFTWYEKVNYGVDYQILDYCGFIWFTTHHKKRVTNAINS